VKHTESHHHQIIFDPLQYLAERRQAVTKAVEEIIQVYFPEAYAERKVQHEQEVTELSRLVWTFKILNACDVINSFCVEWEMATNWRSLFLYAQWLSPRWLVLCTSLSQDIG
jgi:hypothetical protein